MGKRILIVMMGSCLLVHAFAGDVLRRDTTETPDVSARDLGIRDPGALPQNFAGIGLTDPLLYSNIRVTYERQFGQGLVGMQAFYSIGFIPAAMYHPEVLYRERSTNQYGGMNVLFNLPRLQKPSLLVTGLGFRYGEFYESWSPRYDDSYFATSYFNVTFVSYLRIPVGRFYLLPGIELHIMGLENWPGDRSRFMDEKFPVLRLDLLYGF